MAQREFGISFQARQTLLLQVKGAYDMKRIKRKVRRFVRLYWFWVSLGLVLTKVSVEAAYAERGYKAYGGEWLMLPIMLIVGYFVNEARRKPMNEELKEIVEGYRTEGIHISDEEVNEIIWLCNRKMEISKIENGEEYLPLLFKDEVKNYLFRRGVNAVTLLRSLEAKGICVQYAE